MSEPEAEESFLHVIMHSWHHSRLLRILAYFVGTVLILVGLLAQTYGEYQGMKKAQSLEKGASAVLSVSPDQIEPANEGQLVHVVGEAKTTEVLEDPDFDVKLNAVRLVRTVEVYQWQEKKESKKKGKDTVTEYHYDPIWSAKLISSKNFNNRGHDNPASRPFDDKTWQAQEVQLGAFSLPQALIDKLKSDERLPATDTAKLKALDGLYYTSADPARPVVGDARVEFKVVKPGTISVVARQGKGGLEPFQDSEGQTIALAQTGTHTADALFTAEQSKQALGVWAFRVLGFLFLAAGLYLFLTPRVDSADTMPLGEVLALGGIPAGLVFGLAVSLVVSAVMLVLHRPLMSVAALVLAPGAIVVARFLGARKQAKADGTSVLPADAAKLARRIRKGGGRVYVYDSGRNVAVTLDGPKFTDAFLAELDVLPPIVDLSLHNSPVQGAGLARLRCAKTLQALSVRGALADQGLQAIGTLTALTKLSVSGTKITDQNLATLKGLTKLEEADLSETLITDTGLVHLKGWVNLKTLTLTGSAITGPGLDHCKDLKQLQTLRIYSNKLTDAGLAGLKNLRTLKELSAGINEIDGRGLGYLQSLTLLERLDVSHTKVDDKGLGFLTKLPVLRELNLERTKVTDAGLAHLKAIPALEKLELYKTAITDKGLAQLAGKGTLKELCIDRTHVTDAGLPALARIPNLRTLHLDHTGVTNAGLVHLKGLANLSWVTLNNTKVTQKGADDLQQALGGASVEMSYNWRGMLDDIENQQEEEEAKAKGK